MRKKTTPHAPLPVIGPADDAQIRRAEMTRLHVHDVDFDRGTLMIREGKGKGKRDRLIPIGERALACVRKYLDEVRPQLALGDDEGVLFLTMVGDAIGAPSLGMLVKDYVVRSGVNKSGSCHLFRHTMATLMLENGADVRIVQVMLGHAQLTTTEIYTQVAIRLLKEIHTATHPARLEREVKKEEPVS
jgi:integrase/recombinase XerD